MENYINQHNPKEVVEHIMSYAITETTLEIGERLLDLINDYDIEVDISKGLKAIKMSGAIELENNF